MRPSLRYGCCVLTAAVALAGSATPVVAQQTQQAHSAGHGRPDNGFSRNGPWNTPLPANVPLAANSAAVVNNVVQDRQDNFGLWVLETDTFSSPIFTVGRHTPTQNWSYDNCTGTGSDQALIGSLASVPTPPDLITSQGTDEETAIYQPSTDTYWDFWRAQKDSSGHWSACWGGKITHYRHNPGIFSYPLGATATGLPLGAFVIRISELQKGYIDHAVNLNTVRTQANCSSWPANRDDGNTAGSDIPCEGQRFRLNPSFDVDSLYSPVARMIARAMQVYGAIVTDKSGAVATQAEDPRPYQASHGGANPYPALLDPQNLYPGIAQYVVLNEIPLDQLQALPLNYGERRSTGTLQGPQ